MHIEFFTKKSVAFGSGKYSLKRQNLKVKQKDRYGGVFIPHQKTKYYFRIFDLAVKYARIISEKPYMKEKIGKAFGSCNQRGVPTALHAKSCCHAYPGSFVPEIRFKND